MLLDSYVIRIYRRPPAGGGHELVGLVEAEGIGGQRSFSTVEELWAILAERPSGTPRGAAPLPVAESGC
jgi:hypothetical protein